MGARENLLHLRYWTRGVNLTTVKSRSPRIKLLTIFWFQFFVYANVYDLGYGMCVIYSP